jgi:hypothetical protein
MNKYLFLKSNFSLKINSDRLLPFQYKNAIATRRQQKLKTRSQLKDLERDHPSPFQFNTAIATRRQQKLKPRSQLEKLERDR